jgi:hypothetical protein
LLAVGRLGDRKGIEKQKTTWDKAIVDRREDRGPATVKLFMDLWDRKK